MCSIDGNGSAPRLGNVPCVRIGSEIPMCLIRMIMNALPVAERLTSRMTGVLAAVLICMGRRTAVPGWMRRLSLSLCPANIHRRMWEQHDLKQKLQPEAAVRSGPHHIEAG